MCWLLRRAGYRVAWMMQTRSPGWKGWHLEIQVKPNPTNPLEVVALQVVCGSDVSREACNINRARMVLAGRVSPWWRERWNVLYAKS